MKRTFVTFFAMIAVMFTAEMALSQGGSDHKTKRRISESESRDLEFRQ